MMYSARLINIPNISFIIILCTVGMFTSQLIYIFFTNIYIFLSLLFNHRFEYINYLIYKLLSIYLTIYLISEFVEISIIRILLFIQLNL